MPCQECEGEGEDLFVKAARKGTLLKEKRVEGKKTNGKIVIIDKGGEGESKGREILEDEGQ